MSKREYQISEASISAFMKHSYTANTAIIGELPDAFVLQNGKKTYQVKKNAVEKFALDHGFVEGMGYDALPERDKAVFEGNRSRNTMARKENASREFGMKDETLQGFHDQLPSTRSANAQHQASMRTLDDGVDLSKVALGGKSYGKGKATNQ